MSIMILDQWWLRAGQQAVSAAEVQVVLALILLVSGCEPGRA